MNLSIEEIIDSVGKSVSQAQQGLEQYSIRHFFDYFEQNGTAENGSLYLQAKTASVAVPSSSDLSQNTVIEVPLVALAYHKHIALEQVKIRMNLDTTVGEDKVMRLDLDSPAQETADPAGGAASPEPTPGTDCLELVFRVSEPSEGISRVVQGMIKKL